VLFILPIFQRDVRQAILDYGLSTYALKEIAASSKIFRGCYEAWSLLAGSLCRLTGRTYDEARYVCHAMQLLEGLPAAPALLRRHAAVLDAAGAGRSGPRKLTENQLLQSFLGTERARRSAWRFRQHGDNYAASMKFPRTPEDEQRQGNLVALKQFDERTGEKGVLYLQYTESIESFVAMFDICRLANRYTLVIEPSWWGYQDQGFLLLVGKELDVVVEAQDEPDYDYIRSLQCNLKPVRLGAGDWVDPTTFTPGPRASKQFDFVMVANWSPVKRHRLFFRALAAAGLHSARVALIGYPWQGRSKADIERLAARAGLSGVTIFEKVSRTTVAEVVRSSRVGVMLSKREGANRGVYEYLFSDVPVIVSRSNRGVNKSHINEETGCLASDEELPEALVKTLELREHFSPREWALKNTGCNNAWQLLNHFLAEATARRGEAFDRPIARIRSAPNARYVTEQDRLALQSVYDDLRHSLRRASN
jgi:glycosyltransferase involved in cell wall biosynthesis